MRDRLGRFMKGYLSENWNGFKKGKPSWNKGKKFSKEVREKMSEAKKGTRSNSWKGGKYIKDGYIFIYKPKHPFCSQIGYVRKHRLVIEKQIKRYLLPKEKCHHLGARNDNRLHMLMAFISDSAHKRFERGNKYIPSEIIFDGRL